MTQGTLVARVEDSKLEVGLLLPPLRYKIQITNIKYISTLLFNIYA